MAIYIEHSQCTFGMIEWADIYSRVVYRAEARMHDLLRPSKVRPTSGRCALICEPFKLTAKCETSDFINL